MEKQYVTFLGDMYFVANQYIKEIQWANTTMITIKE